MGAGSTVGDDELVRRGIWAFLGAEVVSAPEDATHAALTAQVLRRCLDDGVAVGGVHVIVAGDRLPRALAERALAAGARVSHYYGAAELSFLAWGSDEHDLRLFPGVEARIVEGVVWVRSPYLCLGYLGEPGPVRTAPDGFATVGDRGDLTGAVLTVAGRGEAVVLTGGATVPVEDVERVLRRAVDGDVVVVGVPHAGLGQVVGGAGRPVRAGAGLGRRPALS